MSEREVEGWVDRVGSHGGVRIHEKVGGGRGVGDESEKNGEFT